MRLPPWLSCEKPEGRPRNHRRKIDIVQFEDGTTATADDAYLKAFILNPNAKQVKGYTLNIMPANFREKLTDDQINDIIEYIKSLK
jgi:cytochrome c1